MDGSSATTVFNASKYPHNMTGAMVYIAMAASGVGEGTGACAYRDIIEEPQQCVDGQLMNYAGLGIDKTAILASVLTSLSNLFGSSAVCVSGWWRRLFILHPTCF